MAQIERFINNVTPLDEENLNKIVDALNSLITKVQNIEPIITELINTTNSIKADVENNDSNIAQINEKVTLFENQITGLNDEVDNFNLLVEETNNKIETSEENISSLTKCLINKMYADSSIM